MALRMKLNKTMETVLWRCSGQILRGEEATTLQQKVTSHPSAQIVLDLDGVTGIDAGGLGTLVFLHEWTLANGGELWLMNVPQMVREMLRLTKLDQVLEVCPPLDFFSPSVPVHAA